MSRVSKSRVLFRLKELLHGILWEINNYRLGRVLTIIDATISDQEQRKAMKDLIREAFYSQEFFSQGIPRIIQQFCERLGVEPFDSSEVEKRFLGEDPLLPTPTGATSLQQEFFPMNTIEEGTGEDGASSK